MDSCFRLSTGKYLLLWVSLGLLLLLPRAAGADVGLIVESPTGMLGFLSNVGHVSVWISDGCLDSTGHIRYCEGTSGLVLTSTAYWPNPGAASIPAELFFLGTRAGSAGRDQSAWKATLADIYPNVEPAMGAKYLGRAWLRSLRILKFHTAPEEDRRVLGEMDAVQREYHYSYSQKNCAFYAQSILQRYFGPAFHGNRILELGLNTPRALERALRHRLKEDSVEFETIRFRGSLQHAWRQPSRNICESAIMDPKYAIPLLMYEPYLYVGFAGCYATIRVSTWVSATRRPAGVANSLVGEERSDEEPRLRAFHRLTGGIASMHTATSLGEAAVVSGYVAQLAP